MCTITNCIYCGVPFGNLELSCQNFNCPCSVAIQPVAVPSSKQMTFTYCYLPCSLNELKEQVEKLTNRLTEHENLSARQRMCDCEYLGICHDDPKKEDYCPLKINNK